MLKQIEGSQGVAQAVALCRPEVICAYPISPQTHIVEALGNLTRKGQIENCEYINVESEFAAMSVAIGASVAGARAYTATASQGLLYMVEAVYNASGLGLPIVMTVANRAIGAPINIWNDHSDAMSQRDSGWIQIYAENNQEACDMHIEAFRIAEELSLPVMVCMDGFVLTHAFERIDIPSQEDVDRFLPPYQPRQELDPDNPVSIGAMVGPEAFTEVRYLAHVKHLQALELIPQVQQEFKNVFGRDSGGLVSSYRMEDAELAVVAMGSCVGTIKDTVDELRDAGVKIGVVAVKCFRPFPVAAVREALKGAKRVVVVERTLAVGSGGVLSRDVMVALEGLSVEEYCVIAGLGGRAITKKSLKEVFRKALEGTLPRLSFMDLDMELVNRQLAREKAARKTGPLPEALVRDAVMMEKSSPQRGGFSGEPTVMQETKVRFYQTGTFTVGNRLLDEAARTVQSSMERFNALNSGHRACQGCGEALGARYALDAAMEATKRRLIACNATGCLEVFSTPYPESAWQMPWFHSLFGNTAAVATGMAAAARVKARKKGVAPDRVLAMGGDGGTTDIGFGCLSGMFERNDDVLYICFDNEAYMNTGVQRSSATPPTARTATTMPVPGYAGNTFGQGKNVPAIAMAHGIPYVATATVADLHDLERKVRRAMEFHGARYIHILVPCPLGWGAHSSKTIELARLAQLTGLFPVFEAEYGEVVKVEKIRRRMPVEAYMKPQKRFAHLFAKNADPEVLQRMQHLADRNIARYGLIGDSEGEDVPVPEQGEERAARI